MEKTKAILGVSVRAGKQFIGFSYGDSGQDVDSLSGGKVRVAHDLEKGRSSLYIDLSKNFSARRSDENEYIDAQRLAAEHADLAHISFSDNQACKVLAREYERYPDTQWTVQLDLKDSLVQLPAYLEREGRNIKVIVSK